MPSESFTFTQVIIIGIISAVLSYLITRFKWKKEFEKLEREIHDKYHKELFDDQYKTYKELSPMIGKHINLIEIKKPEDRKNLLIETRDSILKLSLERGLILDENVVSSLMKYCKMADDIISELNKNEDILEDDIIGLTIISNQIMNTMRQNLKLKEIKEFFPIKK